MGAGSRCADLLVWHYDSSMDSRPQFFPSTFKIVEETVCVNAEKR